MTKLSWFAGIVGLSLSACLVHEPSPVRNSSRISVEVLDHSAGKVANLHVHEHGERLFVSGNIWSIGVKSTTHVDLRLLSADGAIIAERQEDIAPARSTTTHDCRHGFVASFPISHVKRSAKLQIVSHDASH